MIGSNINNQVVFNVAINTVKLNTSLFQYYNFEDFESIFIDRRVCAEYAIIDLHQFLDSATSDGLEKVRKWLELKTHEEWSKDSTDINVNNIIFGWNAVCLMITVNHPELTSTIPDMVYKTLKLLFNTDQKNIDIAKKIFKPIDPSLN